MTQPRERHITRHSGFKPTTAPSDTRPYRRASESGGQEMRTHTLEAQQTWRQIGCVFGRSFRSHSGNENGSQWLRPKAAATGASGQVRPHVVLGSTPTGVAPKLVARVALIHPVEDIGWHGQTGAFYALDEKPSQHEPGSWAPLWLLVDNEPPILPDETDTPA